MKFISQKKINIFYILTSVILVSTLLVFVVSRQKLKLTSDLVEHTQDVIRKSDNVLLGVLNIETASRGYVLTRNELFLDPFNKATDSIAANLSALAESTKMNPIQKIRVDSVKQMLEKRSVITRKLILDSRNNQLGAGETMGILEQGKQITDQIRRIIKDIESEEFSLLKQKKYEYENGNKKVEELFLLFIAFVIITYFLISLIIRNQQISNRELKAFASSHKLLSNYSLSLIEASLDPLVTISAEGKIMDLNEATVKITGINRETLIGSDFFEYFTEPQKAREVYLEVFEKGYITDYPLTLRHRNGELTDVLFNGSVYKDDNGHVLGVVIVARDIAEQKWAIELRKANEELRYQNAEKEMRAAELVLANEELAFQNIEKEKRAAELVIANEELIFQNDEKVKRAAELVIANYARSLIEASRDPLFTVSIEGKITDINAATIKVTGVSREKMIGTDFFNYFSEPDRAREGYQQVFSKGFVVDYPLTIMDGNLTDVLFNGSVYKDEKDNVLGAVVVARDITAQKRAERELTEAIVFAEMATVIAEDAKAKAEASTRIAEDAVKAKQQFLSNMSHEIRTPMNAIIGFTKVILKTDLTAKQREYLLAIKISGDALIVLINDILDLAKVDAGRMVFEQIPFRMAVSISAILHLFEPKIQEKNIRLEKEYDSNIPDVLVGDPVRLHQIILNLVSNAVKFTSQGQITVSTQLVYEDIENATVEISITDTGIGIPDSKLDTIFENFQQATSGTSRIYGGTGLGLAIVKQLIESQGGNIRVLSTVGVGSTFTFELVFKKTSIQAAVEVEAELLEVDDEAKNIKILVVEDMVLNQLLMKTLLDDFGFQRDIAGNGKIAIKKLKTNEYDVILMDLQMPEMNGFEATEYIRNTLKSEIPIIALTADVTTADLAKCKAVGMNDYLAKPVDEKILYSKIMAVAKKIATKKPARLLIHNSFEESVKCTNLEYLIHRTKSDPELMMEMISLYLEQTPPLINLMKQSLKDKDWDTLYSAVHKMIPSFSIMGISTDFENMAKQVKEYAGTKQLPEGVYGLVLQIERVCFQACIELKEEFNEIKKRNR